MKVSIVIPAHNAAATIRQCVKACLNQTFPECEVIVVDDGSTDATANVAHEFPVALIRQPKRGPAAARNAGARVAKGEVLAFTDSDCVPHPDWIMHLLNKLGYPHRLGDPFRVVGGTYGIANPESMLARFVHWEIVMRHATYREVIDFAGSYNFAVFKDTFDAVNGFDEDFTAASAEDNDLSRRLYEQGYTIGFVSEAKVDHYHPTRIRPYLRSQARHGAWRVKLYAKHPLLGQGDQYAGPFELLAPIVALLAVFQPIIWMFPQIRNLLFVTMFLTVVWLVYRLMLSWKISRSISNVPLVYCLFVLTLRDFARGLGMLYGTWRFLILRRKIA